MPLTPFHLGPTFLIGIIFQRQINIIAILLASTVIDVRTMYCFFLSGCQLHGPLHTYLGAIIFVIPIIIIIFILKKPLSKITNKLKINQSFSIKSIILGSLIGAWSHVFFDSFMHHDITPFWPILENPLYGMISTQMNYTITAISFFIGCGIYFYKFYKQRK